LIVDYVFDWARDVYRPSILRQLKSLAIGGAYNQASPASDSDIFSMAGNIFDWIPPPPTTIDELDLDEWSTIPNKKNSTLPSTSVVESRLSNEALADICCIFHLSTVSAHLGAALIHEETPKTTTNTVSNVTIWESNVCVLEDADFDLAAQGGGSCNVILRLSANLKNPVGGFYFGRDKKHCDFEIDQHGKNRKISHIHFRICLNEFGVLILEDLSTNGTVVDDILLLGRKKDNGKDYIRALESGSVIIVENYRFAVCIPQHNHESEISYQQNVAAFFFRMNNVRDANEVGSVLYVVLVSGYVSL
jgi:hypothetical protein